MIDSLFDAMRVHGLEIESFPAAGKITRFKTTKKEKTGWVYPFDDGQGASFGDWLTGEKYDWFAGNVETMTEEQKMQFDQYKWEARAKAEKDRNEEHKRAIVDANRIYNDAITCESHAYLERKGVDVCNGLRVGLDGRLIVPVYDKDQNIQSLQFIDNEKGKMFLTGGKMKGGCFVIGELSQGCEAILCEGLATGLTIHKAAKKPVIIAFSASNLSAVYNAFKNQCDIKVAADNDKSGVGIREAQKCEGVKHIFVPTEIGMDFNDLMLSQGIESLHKIFGAKPETDFICFDDMMKNLIKPEWILKGVLARQSINILFGESGAGKSLFALDWAYCIASGKDWEFSKCKEKGSVIYIAGEGNMGLAMRMQAIMQKYESQPNNNIHFSKKSFDFYKEDEVEDIIRQIDLIHDKGIKPVAIFIDTLARNFTGDENSSKDVAVYVKGIEFLCKKYNCAVVTVHHSGHGDKDRVRGSSALKGAHDAEFCVLKDNDFTSTISCTKLKDGKKFAARQFGINEVELIGDVFYDEDDETQLTSVNLQFLDYSTANSKKDVLKGHQKVFMACLNQIIDDKNTVLNAELSLMAKDGQEMVRIENLTEYLKSKIGAKYNKQIPVDCKNALKKKGLIDFDGGYIWVV